MANITQNTINTLSIEKDIVKFISVSAVDGITVYLTNGLCVSVSIATGQLMLLDLTQDKPHRITDNNADTLSALLSLPEAN